MKKIKFILLVSIASTLLSNAFAQLRSPEQFLGYKIGTKFTPHNRIVDYFNHVAENAPSMVKVRQYGKTNEGKSLIAAFISSPSNIADLENIRTNNLSLAGLGKGSKNVNAPAIVWLSFNVHGNEASSSETSLMTLYALVDPSDTRTKQWLQNTIVVIDPCLNPDGRDRYVNWYNSVVGKTPNPSLDAVEHNEPWPSGRTNHYYHDLNRDWAWQTQIETQQRLALYNQWLPQIHVDFHEQYINNPYYFAPAAEPFHEVITPWQRSFQETIGRNHARYLDEQGWLYFTKEYFDLLYPSYGDTYPIYNGAIGMTYEQAGHGLAGLAVITASGDTLTLHDRALHHHTTALSTIEVASQNASKLVSEFQNYFKEAITSGIGDYKSYIIKYNIKDEQRINALTDLLKKNNILYGNANATSLRGYNYNTGNIESFSISSKDIIIPPIQSKSALVKVLFEPQSVLADSFTYDITAWSLPYAYGLNAFASVQTININPATPQNTPVNNPVADPYGYIFHWNGPASVKLASSLIQKGIKLRFSEQPFEINGQVFERGSMIILKTSNKYVQDLWRIVREEANKHNISLSTVRSGFVDKGNDFGSEKIRIMKTPKVALPTGESTNSNPVGEIWHYFDNGINYPLTRIDASNFNSTNWSDYDVIIFPRGYYSFLSDKTTSEQIKKWVQDGGRLVLMENAVSQFARLDWSIKSKKPEERDEKQLYADLKKYEDRERDYLPNSTPGAIFRVDLDNTHPLAFGYPSYYYTLKQDNNIYNFFKDGGWNVGTIKKETAVAGFVGSQLKEHLQDGLLFGVQNIGNGNIVYLADNVLFRSFWENGKLMFANAVFLVGQ